MMNRNDLQNATDHSISNVPSHTENDGHHDKQEEEEALQETENTTTHGELDDDDVDDNNKNDIDDDLEQSQQQQQQVDLDTLLLNPSYIMRKQMEMRAQHLIQQVELIDQSKTSRPVPKLVLPLTMVNKKNNHNNIDEATELPPRLLSLSTTSTVSNDASMRSSSSSTVSLMTNHWVIHDRGTHHFDSNSIACRRQHSTSFEPQQVLYHHDSALADDLSSNDDTDTTTTTTTSQHVTTTHIDTNSNDIYYKSRMDELEQENARLRQMVTTCSEAAMMIQTNNDLKISRLQLELVQIKEQLQYEMGIHAKMSVGNASLRKQLNVAVSDLVQNKQQDYHKKALFGNLVSLHQRELITEKHLNTLILSRNQTMNELTEVKKIILSSCCYSCRQSLVPQLHRARNVSNNSSSSSNQRRSSFSSSQKLLHEPPSVEDGTLSPVPPKSSILLDGSSSPPQSSIPLSPQSASKSRSSHRHLPTYQSSARQLVLDQQPPQPLYTCSSSSTSSINSSSISSHRKLKSCLKKSITVTTEVENRTGGMNDDNYSSTSNAVVHGTTTSTHKQQQPQQSSPTSVTTMIIDPLSQRIDSTTSILGTAPNDNQHTNDNDAWSSTSDMSVNTMPLPVSNDVATMSAIPQSPILTTSTTTRIHNVRTKIPDARLLRKLDLQRHDALLQFTASKHHHNSTSSLISTASSTNPPKEQQQQRHRFFGLRIKKGDR